MKKLLVLIAAVFALLSFGISCATSSQTPADTPDQTPAQTPPAAPPQTPPPAAQTPSQPEPRPASAPPDASENTGITSIRVGQFNVQMLVDAERDGDAGIIPGASSAIKNRYIPASGFKHSTNACLIRTPSGQNVLVDSGFGNTIFEKMDKLGVKPDQIDIILLTHLHGDHIGGLHKDGRALFPKAKIYLDSAELNHFTRVAPNQAAISALNAYAGNVITFEALPLSFLFKEILPGIRAIASHWHTPGHTAYLLVSGMERLLIAGDFLHVAYVQFPHPEISATYDMDQNEAANSRVLLMEYAAAHRIPIGGMHIPYPGVGNVEADGDGYRFIPLK